MEENKETNINDSSTIDKPLFISYINLGNLQNLINSDNGEGN